jgi:hypothetical protein
MMVVASSLWLHLSAHSADTTGSQRHRYGIFAEPQPKQNFSPIGVAYSDDVAPERSFVIFAVGFYKDASPTGFPFTPPRPRRRG